MSSEVAAQQQARAALERALEAAPLEPGLHRALALSKQASGDALGALAHLIAAQTLDEYASGERTGPPINLGEVATGYFMKDEHEEAARWYRLVLLLDPDFAPAHLNLAAIHALAGRGAQAQACRDRAYQIQRVFVEQAGAPAHRVLVLCVGRTWGNVPVEILLPGDSCARIKYVIDYAADLEDAQLPPYDLVFNAIGEPDVAAPLAARLARFVRACHRPILNPPAAVARTQRHHLPELLGGIADVVVAPCIRLEQEPATALAQALDQSGILLPVLLRPLASHGGEGLVRCDTLEQLAQRLQAAPAAQYLTSFVDYRSPDGHFRKYRIVFVDGAPWPYNLAISREWMVHYFSAEMEANAWKLDEERRFLEAPAQALGERAWAAISAIGRRLDLDYGGIDFSLLPDGRVLVFEANATMLVHRQRVDGPLAHKNVHVQRIVDAFGRHLLALRGVTAQV